jgi:L-asparagine oxygenase
MTHQASLCEVSALDQDALRLLGSSQPVLRVNLTDEVAAELHSEFRRLPNFSDDVESALAELLGAAALLPIDLRKQLLRFRAAPDAPGALLITGLPIDGDLPPTPTDGAQPPYKPGRISEFAILSIALLLGEPVAYQAEKEGELVQNVFPTRSQQAAPSNESSAVPLDFHTELAFSRGDPERPMHLGSPDFILLLGLRSPEDRSASTLLAEVRALCERLDASALQALRMPAFQLRAPHSFTRDSDGSRPWSPPAALVYGPSDAPAMAFDAACGIRALSPEAETALDALRAACADPDCQVSLRLGPGDLLVINNRSCAHARSEYVASFDGRDRWLQRVYVRHAIQPLKSVSSTSFRVLA